MSNKPTAFFDDWEKSKDNRKGKVTENYQLKILKKYFTPILGDVDLKNIWYDRAVVNKLEEVKFRVSDKFFNAIDIKNYPTMHLLELYVSPKKFLIWADIMSLITEHGEAGIIFPLYKRSNYILHNFPRQPDDVLTEPKIIWPGNAGTDLTLEKLDVFLIEYNPGD